MTIQLSAKRRWLALVIVLAALGRGGSAWAAPFVTLSFSGTLTQVNFQCPSPAPFGAVVPGQSWQLTYTFDAATTDVDGLPLGSAASKARRPPPGAAEGGEVMKRRLTAIGVALVAGGLAAPAPAAPTAINTCRTIGASGSYLVGRNLSAAVDCLKVAADFVTIDLGGFAISGGGAGAGGKGITDGGAPRRGIEVRNGSLTGFNEGMGLASTTGAVIEGVRASSNGTGIHVGIGALVRGNVASGNVIGIHAADAGTIENNVADGNGGIGINTGDHCRIAGNSAGGSLGNGIRTGNHSVVIGNATYGTAGTGILAGDGGTLADNTSAANFVRGIEAGAGSTVARNTVRDNGAITNGDGIKVTCPSNVIGNTATGSPNNLVLNGVGCNDIDNLF